MWLKDMQSYRSLIWQHNGKEKTLKKVLLEDMNISVRLLYTLKKENRVMINEKTMKFHDIVNNQDIVNVELPKEKNDYEAFDKEIKIIYENDDLIVVEKEPYMVVHPTKGHPDKTLANALVYTFNKKGILGKIRFVNRLDRDTSGILIVAKNSYCHSVMTKDDKMWEMDKTYAAVVEGEIKDSEGTIDMPILKDEDGIKRIVHEDGQRAITHYKVAKRLKGATLLEVRLETGRTHQIRVHFSHIGHPLLGDELYGGSMKDIKRQALHCSCLGFYSPREADKIIVRSELPYDIKNLVENLSV